MARGGDLIHERRFADVVVVSPTGRLERGTSNAFQEQISQLISRENAAQPRIVIDMSGIRARS